jgi:hypothetical protein
MRRTSGRGSTRSFRSTIQDRSCSATGGPDDVRSMRRAGVDNAASFGPTGAPYSPQSRASASSGLPHAGQAAASTDPQWMQNLRPGRFPVPQVEQITLEARSVAERADDVNRLRQ